MFPYTCQGPLHLCRAQVRPSWLRKAKGELPGRWRAAHFIPWGSWGNPRVAQAFWGIVFEKTVPHGISHHPSAAGHEVTDSFTTKNHLPYSPLSVHSLTTCKQGHFSRQSLLAVQDKNLVETILRTDILIWNPQLGMTKEQLVYASIFKTQIKKYINQWTCLDVCFPVNKYWSSNSWIRVIFHLESQVCC